MHPVCVAHGGTASASTRSGFYYGRMSIEIVYETHSTSVHNEEGIATGWLDGTLSETGRRQAAELGARRRNNCVDAVFTSDLGRAVETARIALDGSGIPVHEDARLRECNYGSMNGMPRAELDVQRARRLDEPWPGGESWREAVARVGGFLDELERTHDGKRVVIIGHVATRWALDHYLNHVPLEDLVDSEFQWQEGWEYTMDATPRYEISRIADLERPDGWAPIRRSLDVRSFGVNTWTAHEDGGQLIPPHDEVPSRHEELYVVLSGHATFAVDGAEIDAPTGTIVLVRDPAAKRGAVAVTAGTTVLSAGGEPGAAYRPRAWEVNADIFGLLDEGKPAEAKTVLLEALERYDDRESLLYNLACAEAGLGEVEAALEHLAESLRLRPSYAESAREDGDFEPLRGDARFAALVGGG